MNNLTGTLLTYMLAADCHSNIGNNNEFKLKYHLRDKEDNIKNKHSPKKRTKKRSKKKRGY